MKQKIVFQPLLCPCSVRMIKLRWFIHNEISMEGQNSRISWQPPLHLSSLVALLIANQALKCCGFNSKWTSAKVQSTGRRRGNRLFNKRIISSREKGLCLFSVTLCSSQGQGTSLGEVLPHSFTIKHLTFFFLIFSYSLSGSWKSSSKIFFSSASSVCFSASRRFFLSRAALSHISLHSFCWCCFFLSSSSFSFLNWCSSSSYKDKSSQLVKSLRNFKLSGG